MSNDLSLVAPLLLKQSLFALRENAIMPRLVSTSYSPSPEEHGTPIQIPIPKPSTVYTVTPGSAGTASNIDPRAVVLTTETWKATRFELTDKEITEAMAGIVPMQMSEAMKALANTIDADLISQYKNVGGAYGTTAAPDDKDDITGVIQKLDEQICPMENRVFVVDPATKREFLEIAATTGSDTRGDGASSALIAGRIGQTYGFDFFMDQNLAGTTHSSGTVGTDAVAANNQADVNGALSAGAVSMSVDGAGLPAGTITQGTVFRFAGLDQDFTVTANVTLSGSAGTVAFLPALPVGVANDVKVTFQKSHTINGLAFNPMAFALATRAFPPVQSGLGSIIEQDVDPVSNLALRLEITRANKVTSFELDILYGVATVRPEFACRLVTYTGTGTSPA